MSAFPRIPPEHPLTEAARITNAQAEEIGLEDTLDWLGVGASAGQVAYLAEQRALRAVAAHGGYNMGLNPREDEKVARGVIATEQWRALRMLLIACYMDGIAIGWKGRELHDNAEQDATDRGRE